MELEYNEQLNVLTHGYYLKLLQCYRPHTPIPSRQELLQNRYEQVHHMNIRSLTNDIDINYDEYIETKRKIKGR